MALTLLPALVHRLTNCDSCYIPSARFVKSYERKRDKEWISAFDRLSTNSAESTAFRAAPSPNKRCSNANAAPFSTLAGSTCAILQSCPIPRLSLCDRQWQKVRSATKG